MSNHDLRLLRSNGVDDLNRRKGFIVWISEMSQKSTLPNWNKKFTEYSPIRYENERDFDSKILFFGIKLNANINHNCN